MFFIGQERKKMGSFTTVFLTIIWALSILYGEMFAFWVPSLWTCSWPHHHLRHSSSSVKRLNDSGDYVKIAVLTDPQLMDRTSLRLPPTSLALEVAQFYTDLFMRRAFLSSILPFKPDVILFLGDYFDGGPILSDKEWQESLSRFKHIFDLNMLQKTTNTQVYFLSGNHDIGYEAFHSQMPEVVRRYEKEFGARNYKFALGNVDFVAIDSQTLDDNKFQSYDITPVHSDCRSFPIIVLGSTFESYFIIKSSFSEELKVEPYILCHQSFHVHLEDKTRNSEGNLTSATWKFISNVSQDSSSTPRVLLTHIPLYRPDWTSCGPHRSSHIINQRISRSPDNQQIMYQNYVTEKSTDNLLNLIRPALILSGHDHDQCTVTHISKYGPVEEHTLGTISWQQGNLFPSFMLLSASNVSSPDGFALEDVISTHLCFLPIQTYIYIWYIILFIMTLLMVLFGPTKEVFFFHYFGYLRECIRSLINSTILGGVTKEKNEDENCEYEMMWDTEGSMHLIKKVLKSPPKSSADRVSVERGNAVMRSTAKRQIEQEVDVLMPSDVNVHGLDTMIPSRMKKSKTKLVIRRLLRAIRVLSFVAAFNAPLYMMLLFKDWIDK